ncbi:FYVE_ RhoGEF and PH domaincontaining protein 4like, partial [Caligus rogercresseyi]
MEFEPRKSFSTLISQEDPVTLISYYSGEYSGRGRLKSNTVVPPVLAKKSERFFKTLRRRSKSASRLGEPKDIEDKRSNLTITSNGERLKRNPERIKKSDKVTLVGFSSSCNSLSDQEGEARSSSKKPHHHRFSTLKTSREVKMERDRLRQERLSKFTQETKDLLDKLKSEGSSIHRSIFNNPSGKERFFEEARERLGLCAPASGSEEGSGNDFIISSFLREHQERFSSLLATQRRSSASSLFPSSYSSRKAAAENPAKAEEGGGKLNEKENTEERRRSSSKEEEGGEGKESVLNSSGNDKEPSSSSSPVGVRTIP